MKWDIQARILLATISLFCANDPIKFYSMGDPPPCFARANTPTPRTRPPMSSSSSDTAFSSSEASSDDDLSSGITWIEWFCSLPGHDFFSHVDEEFIEDDFNLTGLPNMVPYYLEAMDLILDLEPEDTGQYPDANLVESSAQLLYGLVHARFVTARQGLQSMLAKLEHRQFGICPRVFCYTFPLLPVGTYDQPGLETVKLYCHNCKDTYNPQNSRYNRIDGAFFGTTFPQLLFQTYPELYKTLMTAICANALSPTSEVFPEEAITSDSKFERGNQDAPGNSQHISAREVAHRTNDCVALPQVYVPRIFGFRVHESSITGPKCAWLRWHHGVDIRTGYYNNTNNQISLEGSHLNKLEESVKTRQEDASSIATATLVTELQKQQEQEQQPSGAPGVSSGYDYSHRIDNDGDAVMGK